MCDYLRKKLMKHDFIILANYPNHKFYEIKFIDDIVLILYDLVTLTDVCYTYPQIDELLKDNKLILLRK